MVTIKRLIKETIVTTGINPFLVKRANAAIILGLHHVDEPDGSMLSQRISPVTPYILETLLGYLRSLDYSFVSLGGIINSSDYSRKVVITFDDGFRSIYTKAFPILQKFHAPFTVFLTTATLGAKHLLWLHRIYASVDRLDPRIVYDIFNRCLIRTKPGISLREALGILVSNEPPDRLLLLADELATAANLTISDETDLAGRLYLKLEEVAEMTKYGMTIGAHGHNHWGLAGLDRTSSESEIKLCREKIKEIFNIQVEHYSLAYGKSNIHIRSILEKFEFKSLCKVEAGLVQSDTDAYALPRLMVGADTDKIELAGQITLAHLRKFVSGNSQGS